MSLLDLKYDAKASFLFIFTIYIDEKLLMSLNLLKLFPVTNQMTDCLINSLSIYWVSNMGQDY